ncbi:MAG: PAS domain S-box protein [Microcoleus sp. PH2017_29_MFU_D_A]|jgi:PAS domain S-box-containing protein|uniref:sensor histidine kinase n=1 Tax=unclassified Microcoleus TaxID=2642155 RepID=UPI001DDCCDDC|nr:MULTISPECIES: ATP-binding protein [unclassified Microcoleus]MCC3418701.1 PAS domain S-box protein [Microcoleus sp. PH2017_07_MST_O_A]MCC3430102.1 PAS domain S-box protein [Microcoleus sp. PH2017_04_SCI_O_A]MCC3440581.1 PAS domain S-box protein [Microcoleus sp. PH2017_03_ELD_O_A]MCC3466678.1 PAS domain S-box protein [Microcoleus sp. PH2017_06_SFM_O_A]MCC3502618.1 PAS domain S-box protein [Microcoleus sp. PH2017_19_SFW_U_A]MCC3509302.1 PAS domain S-box protein [Microcoleus sp. PH2017_17_BER_
MWIKILLIEDNPADADLLAELLEVSGGVQWELVSVEFLHEAIAQLSKQHFDIVLLDLSLPDSRGLETLTRLREVAPDTAMVVMTGLDDEAIALESVRLGAQDYIVKGQITTPLLVRTIRYAIERSQTFQMLRESERRFRAIFDSSFQLTKLLTPEGVVLEVNETALDFAGVRSQDIVGRPIWQMVIWPQTRNFSEQLQFAIAKASRGEFFRSEIDLVGKNGQIVTVDFSLKPVKNETGQVLLLIAEARDISDRKRAEAEILKALAREKELSELRAKFVTMVSHEFRTPLTTIQFSAGLLQDYSAKWSEEKKSTHFVRIQLAIKRMTELLEDILVIGKIEANTLPFQPISLNLEKFCRQLVEEQQLNDSNQHPIAFIHEGGNCDAQMDEKLLRQMLGNVLSNAIKYSPAGSSVSLRLNCQNGKAVFQVQDQGIGIPQTDIERILETFYRATNVGTISGTGLGLAIVKRAVELHGGKLAIESQEGKSTTFTITLPLICASQ